MLQKEQRTSIELNADHCVAISLWRSDITRQIKCHDLAPPKGGRPRLASRGCRFNRSTQHKLEIVLLASRSLESFWVSH
jgi:hypothetical protein